jgi:hypothetical protein
MPAAFPSTLPKALPAPFRGGYPELHAFEHRPPLLAGPRCRGRFRFASPSGAARRRPEVWDKPGGLSKIILALTQHRLSREVRDSEIYK